MKFPHPSLLTLLSVLMTPSLPAAGPDLHQLWENLCVECHGHAGDFARKFFKVENGELRGPHRSHTLRLFMHNHYLQEPEVDAIYNMLLAQANIPPRFKEECSHCHNTAATFVRDNIELRDGALYSRKTGTPINQFLQSHRKLSQDDIAFFMEQLTRVAKEVFRP